jgi:hypothetical protein
MQDRVNEHLYVVRILPRSTRRFVMNAQNERPPNLHLEPQYALHATGQAAIPTPKPTAADRIYQLAAVTAGIFFLATLL